MRQDANGMEHELQMLLKAPGNECCADCKAIFPRYASITLAIFLCNRCYNIHRCMDAHITHTKSVGFDKWSYEEVSHMSSIGNAIANLYWEGFLSKLFSFQIAPQIIMLFVTFILYLLMFCDISMLTLKSGVDESRCF
jgi:stromal membrane-associated protein